MYPFAILFWTLNLIPIIMYPFGIFVLDIESDSYNNVIPSGFLFWTLDLIPIIMSSLRDFVLDIGSAYIMTLSVPNRDFGNKPEGLTLL